MYKIFLDLIKGFALKSFIGRALNNERVDAMVVPIGKGELVYRKR